MERMPQFQEIQNRPPELFRGTIGFDYVFEENTGQIKCIELNAGNSGIRGMLDIEGISKAEKIMVGMRMTEVPSADQGGEGLVTRFDACFSAFFDQSLFKNGYRNELLFKEICSNKAQSKDFIPEELATTSVNESEFENLSDQDLLIVKEVMGRAGEGIEIVRPEECAKFLKNRNTSLVVEKLIEAKSADKGPEGYAAALRHLVDFIVTEDLEVYTGFQRFYQRVSPYRKDDDSVSLENRFVVNKSTGAKSFEVSDKEKEAATLASDSIIKKLIVPVSEQINWSRESERAQRAKANQKALKLKKELAEVLGVPVDRLDEYVKNNQEEVKRIYVKHKKKLKQSSI